MEWVLLSSTPFLKVFKGEVIAVCLAFILSPYMLLDYHIVTSTILSFIIVVALLTYDSLKHYSFIMVIVLYLGLLTLLQHLQISSIYIIDQYFLLTLAIVCWIFITGKVNTLAMVATTTVTALLI